MGVAPLALEVTLVCCMAGYLLHYYGNWRKQNITVTVAAFIAWYFSFLIIFTLPLDISNTCYRQCLLDNTPKTTESSFTTALPNTSDYISESTISPRVNSTSSIGVPNISSTTTPSNALIPLSSVCKQPWSFVRQEVLETLWHVVYWTSQVLTWLVIPLMQSYANSGNFTILGKLRTGIIENAIYYGLYLLIFGVCLIYIAIRPDIQVDGKSLKVLATTASNTWGLTLLVLMWGYGLVEVPRRMWNNSHKGKMLSYTYFKLAKLSVEKTEAEENLEDVLDDVKKAADTIRYTNSLRKHVETILSKCPEATQESIRRATRDDYEDYHNPTETPTDKSLVRLHKSVIRATQTQLRTQCQWDRFMKRAFQLEDVAQNQNNSRREFRRSNQYDGKCKVCYSATLEWYWKCVIYPWGLRVLSVLLIVFSILVVWSECLFFIKSPTLSVFAVFLELAKDNYNYVGIEIMCILTMAYLSVCAYYTVFKVRFFNYYYLAGHHQTNEYSLLFCGMMLTRLTPPLCLNFLGLIHMDSHVTKEDAVLETSFTQIMGHMDVIKFISDGFNIYYPIAIVLLCFATYFNICGRVLHFLGFQQFMSDDEMTQEFVDEGKNLVMRERRKQERQEETAARRREWNDRFGGRSSRSNVEQEMSDPARSTDEDVRGASRKRPSSKHSVARSPQENDRSNLLKEVEPVGYTDPPTRDPFKTDPFRDDMYDEEMGVHQENIGTGYQSRAVRPSSLRMAMGSSSRRTQGSQSKAPSKGIFDDI